MTILGDLMTKLGNNLVKIDQMDNTRLYIILHRWPNWNLTKGVSNMVNLHPQWCNTGAPPNKEGMMRRQPRRSGTTQQSGDCPIPPGGVFLLIGSLTREGGSTTSWQERESRRRFLTWRDKTPSWSEHIPCLSNPAPTIVNTIVSDTGPLVLEPQPNVLRRQFCPWSDQPTRHKANQLLWPNRCGICSQVGSCHACDAWPKLYWWNSCGGIYISSHWPPPAWSPQETWGNGV